MEILFEPSLGEAKTSQSNTGSEVAESLSSATSATRSIADAPRGHRKRTIGLSIREETNVDYVATAPLADEGFGFAPGTFRPDHLRWLYEDAFSDGTTILGAFAGDKKVGHLALVHHSVTIDGKIERAVALMDLFILPAFRSRTAMTGLYGAVETLCRERGFRFIIAVPNNRAAGVNRRYLNLSDIAPLDIRVGFAWPLLPGRHVTSYRISELDRETGVALLGGYCDPAVSGLHWSGERLWARLRKPGAHYAIHAGRRVLAISASRPDRRAPHTMICALLPRPGAVIRRRDVAAVTAAACRMHGNPLFVYTGLNAMVPRPGLLLPKRLRPSPMVLQMRDFALDAAPVSLGRFEPLDFDFG